MKAYLEIVEYVDEIVTASTDPEECCDMDCPTDVDQMAGIY
jgi:hypothetical protein